MGKSACSQIPSDPDAECGEAMWDFLGGHLRSIRQCLSCGVTSPLCDGGNDS